MGDRGKARGGRLGLDRRAFCTTGAAALLGLAASPSAAWARSFLDDAERRVPIRNLWTGERRDLVYWRDGDYDRHALDAYSHLLRDRRNGEVEPIFYGVLDQLFFLWKALGRPARIDLVSGYRSAGTNAWLSATTEGVARNSLHTIGMAVDIRVPGLATERCGARRSICGGAASASTGVRTSSTSTSAPCEAGSFRREHRLVRRPHEWWCFRLSVPIVVGLYRGLRRGAASASAISAVMAARSLPAPRARRVSNQDDRISSGE